MNNYKRFVVTGNPVTKKNSSQIVKNKSNGRWFMVPSRQYKAFEKEAVKQLTPLKDPMPITRPVNIRYSFYMATHRQVDGLNLSAAMDDILVKAGILQDDSRDIVAAHDGTRVFYGGEDAKTIIEIWDEDDYEQWKSWEN